MTEQWEELKETIIELRDNDGTATQQQVCQFLVNLMNVLEKHMQKPKTGHWIGIENEEMEIIGYYCSECDLPMETEEQTKFCPNCGIRMKGVE